MIGFDAMPELVPLIAPAGGDDLLSPEEGRLEGFALTGTDVQDCDFEHHGHDDSPLLVGQSAALSLNGSGAQLPVAVPWREHGAKACVSGRFDDGLRPAQLRREGSNWR